MGSRVNDRLGTMWNRLVLQVRHMKVPKQMQRKGRVPKNYHSKVAESYDDKHLSAGGHTFYVKLLGQTLVDDLENLSGINFDNSGVSRRAVDRILSLYKMSKLQKVLVIISNQGIVIQNSHTKETLFDIPVTCVVYCANDLKYEKVSSIIVRPADGRSLQCYAFLSEKKGMAADFLSRLTATVRQAWAHSPDSPRGGADGQDSGSAMKEFHQNGYQPDSYGGKYTSMVEDDVEGEEAASGDVGAGAQPVFKLPPISICTSLPSPAPPSAHSVGAFSLADMDDPSPAPSSSALTASSPHPSSNPFFGQPAHRDSNLGKSHPNEEFLASLGLDFSPVGGAASAPAFRHRCDSDTALRPSGLGTTGSAAGSVEKVDDDFSCFARSRSQTNLNNMSMDTSKEFWEMF